MIIIIIVLTSSNSVSNSTDKKWLIPLNFFLEEAKAVNDK